MKWSATSSSARWRAMTETSAKRPRRWDSAAARCIGACKNTAWNETPHVRTSHPASGAGGGITRIAHSVYFPLGWSLFVADGMDTDFFYHVPGAGPGSVFSASMGLFPAVAFQLALQRAGS